MRSVRSERLKKFETEFDDLENWLKLGLVPKKDIKKHKEEIATIKIKIEEERDRLRSLKESGEVEEYVAPKKGPQRTGYTDLPTIPDMDVGDTAMEDNGYEVETEGDDANFSEGGRTEDDEGAAPEESKTLSV